MTIDAIMAKIHKVHPGTRLVQRGRGTPWVANDPIAGDIGSGTSPFLATMDAYNAIRKAQPRPMTVAQAKAFIRSLHSKAHWGVLRDHSTGQQWFYIWDGVGNGDAIWGCGETLGQAWKIAANHLRTLGTAANG